MTPAASAAGGQPESCYDSQVEPPPAPEAVLAAVARHLADRLSPSIDRSHAGPLLDGSIEPARLSREARARVHADDADAGLLGDVLEELRGREERRRRGAFFTSRASADLVVARATEDWSWPDRPTLCDPACGGGAFLLAAARVLEARGLSRSDIAGDLLFGADTDPLAVATTRAAIAIWCRGTGGGDTTARIVVADTLAQGTDAWPAGPDAFDLIVGNPPFQSQLATRTARSREDARRLADRFGDLARGYADSASLFLVAAASMTRPSGRFALIVPESFLAARDATPARRAVVAGASLVGLWLPRTPLFAAAVRVCVPVFDVGARGGQWVRRWEGPDAAPVAPWPTGPSHPLDPSTWAPLAADLLGVPAVELTGGDRVGDRAEATAGFRDQFYGLRPFVVAQADAPDAGTRLITSGTIDPMHDLWPQRVVKFAGERFTRPVVDVERLRREAPVLARWGESLLAPKLLVATQTRVVEVLVDERGELWPSVPVIAVVARADDLWPLAAALSSPAVSALCLGRHAGAALSGDAIKLSAKQILDLPLPEHQLAWDEGVRRLRAAAAASIDGQAERWRHELRAFGEAMGPAYGVHDEVFRWWFDRLPPFR